MSVMSRDVLARRRALAQGAASGSGANRLRAKAPILDRRMDELCRLSSDDLQRDILILKPHQPLSVEMVSSVRQFIRAESAS
jgi:hypothetical protein